MEVNGDFGKSGFGGTEGAKAWLDWVAEKKISIWSLTFGKVLQWRVLQWSGFGERDARDYDGTKYC